MFQLLIYSVNAKSESDFFCMLERILPRMKDRNGYMKDFIINRGKKKKTGTQGGILESEALRWSIDNEVRKVRDPDTAFSNSK